MEGRALGYRLLALVVLALAIFGFFGGLMRFSEDTLQVALVKRQREDVRMDLPLLWSAMTAYAEDHDGSLPPMDSPEALKTALYPKYVSNGAAFVRHGDSAPYLPNAELSGQKRAEWENPGETVVLSEPEGGKTAGTRKYATSERAALYLDGTVRMQTPETAEPTTTVRSSDTKTSGE